MLNYSIMDDPLIMLARPTRLKSSQLIEYIESKSINLCMIGRINLNPLLY